MEILTPGKVGKGDRNSEKSPRKGGTLRLRSGHSLELLKHTNQPLLYPGHFLGRTFLDVCCTKAMELTVVGRSRPWSAA